MNDDEFEKKLHALTGGLHRPDPTPAWKADILARARREADAIPFQRTLPPRWLMLGWAAAWVAILVMDFTTPGDATPGRMRAAARRTSAPDALARRESWSLLAYHQRLNLDPDFPQ